MEKKNIINGLFFGSIWGFIEATLGFLLHLTTLPTGAILFPIALILMNYSYKKSNSTQTIVIMSVVASIIKLSNLFMLFAFIPDYVPVMIVSIVMPACAILIEGLVFSFVINFTLAKNKPMNALHVIFIVYGYTTLYRSFQFLMNNLGVPMKNAFAEGFNFIDNILISGIPSIIVGAILITIYNMLNFDVKPSKLKLNYSLVAFCVAIISSSFFYMI